MIAPDAATFAAAHAAGRPQVVWTRVVAHTQTPGSAIRKHGLAGRGGVRLE